jgi:hypothetical protein
MKYIQARQHLNHIECEINFHRPTKRYVQIQTLTIHQDEKLKWMKN